MCFDLQVGEVKERRGRREPQPRGELDFLVVVFVVFLLKNLSKNGDSAHFPNTWEMDFW